MCVMGSDDALEGGAIDSWLRMQERTRAAMVLARIHHVGGANEPAPPVRPFRTTGLDPVKDRLSYRSAPLGLISREHFGWLRLADGLASGEDIPYVSRIWFSGQPLAFDRTGPAYLVHHDADDRVTGEARSIAADFEFLRGILDDPWFAGLGRAARVALVVKLVRSHLFDAVINRSSSVEWPAGERAEFAQVADRLISWAPGTVGVLSRADRDLLAALRDPASPTPALQQLVMRRARYRSLGALTTRNPLTMLHRQAPLRTFAAAYLVTAPVPASPQPDATA